MRASLAVAVTDGAAAADINPEWPKQLSRMASAFIEAEEYGDAKMVLEKGRCIMAEPEDLEALYE